MTWKSFTEVAGQLQFWLKLANNKTLCLKTYIVTCISQLLATMCPTHRMGVLLPLNNHMLYI